MIRRILDTAVFGYFALFMVLILALGFRWHTQRKAPVQPINYSHQIHVGKLNLECAFCHETADKSYYAGVPSVQKCMSCHSAVKTDSPEIQKLTKYWNDKEPVPWNRVHRIRIRNHIYFTHKRHIAAGVQCEHCHGQLAAMPRVRQVKSMKMGFCVSCHEANHAPTDCVICHK
ncbi:MAG TPA: cytochrome c3 family protein [Candidatus Krumholzibacteria bacterium]|nr:cytochrome c3 family protein [Candidatus Krumholzibacteria bacterium]